MVSKEKIMWFNLHEIVKGIGREDVGSREGEKKAGSEPIQAWPKSVGTATLSGMLFTLLCSTHRVQGREHHTDPWWESNRTRFLVVPL